MGKFRPRLKPKAAIPLAEIPQVSRAKKRSDQPPAEIAIADKARYLKNHYPFSPVPKLSDKRYCLHCDEEVIIGNFKVFRDQDGNELICCPNAPECDGTVIDWMKQRPY